jgi:pimeloyl-ACP methyl ester carboxylesterase
LSETVIVVHGLFMPGHETALLRRRLRAAGFLPALFRFPTLRGSLAQNAARLADFAARVDGERPHFVGYSLGGVITLQMLAQAEPANIGRIVCIGAPLAGSGAATRLARFRIGRQFIGRSLLEHTERGGMARWDRPMELGIVAGTRSLGFGRLVGGLRGQNDGTVAVEEACIPGATDQIMLPVSHAQMLFDGRVASQTIHFLKHGRFAR